MAFEGKLDLKDGECVILDHIANKLQMYNAEFHEHHYKLVDCINDSGEVKAQRRIFDDHDLWMMDIFTQITNLQSHERTVTSTPKSAEEMTVYS